jgi:2-dehydropantoate 2-reductase
MKIVILGAGALGSVLAAHLARAGQDVSLIARGERAARLAESGVRVQGLAEFTAKVPIVELPAELGACDAFVLTAKTYDTDAALEGVRELKPDMALSVQNGVAKNDALAGVYGWQHTVGCIANYSGEVQADGSVQFTRNEGLYLGEFPSGASSRTEELVRIINDAGIRTFARDDIQSVEWSKFATWMALTAVSLLTRLYTHLLYQDEGLNRLQIRLIREAVSLADASGIEVADLGGLIQPATVAASDDAASLAALRRAGAAMEAGGLVTHRMSAAQDLLRGRRLEVEETFGYAVARATELGLGVPALQTCYRLLTAIDRHQQPSSAWI